MAGAMVAGIARYLDNVPVTIVVEPDSAACVLESIKTGKIEKIDTVSYTHLTLPTIYSV